ncbi:acetylornithine transaminase [Acetobacterium paludosum]|uniref:Acetylornithine aminotransferase n=1 Tax=Acetobacterium paludosum TaxID=52693 RepID=A0A923HV32_9FIRM|nr:acetylornithine transaminase [Acetobacterium paludosum]MBC3889094.1 acetylornithine transaminase [Acetobacterium paludosum]
MDLITRGNNVIMETYKRFPLVFDKGQGCVLTDINGKEYLDFMGGIAVNALGYAHPGLMDAMKTQMEKLVHVSNLYWTEPGIELAELLTKESGLDKVFFCNSGAEACEAALKLCRIYGKLKKHQNAVEIIAMDQSFHGRTYGAISATGQKKYQANLEPLLPEIYHVPFNDIEALKAQINPNICGIILEPIQGEGGIHPADPEYLKAVRKICDQENIVLIFDEVQTGIGRSGKLFAYQQYGVVPDVVTMAKGLGGGVPIGGIIAKNHVAEVFTPGTHAATFGGNPFVCATGKYVIETLTAPGFFESVAEKGAYLKSQLEALKKEHPSIKDVRGMGLMIGAEVDGDLGVIVAKAMDKGLLVITAGSNAIRFVPPLIITKEQIDQAVQIFSECL